MPQEAQLQTGRSARELRSTDGFANIIGESTQMQKIFGLVQKVAGSESTILLHGETGTGKGLIAKAIHRISPRCNKPFVAINCGAIPENLLESELFGHMKGAFTGASQAKAGKFDAADGGTIFLDEIGDMSPDLQVKILKVLEEKAFEPVGSNKTHRVDVRIIAATHRDLEEAVQKGRFREDLFYRLYVIPIKLPPLRERRSDIPHLVRHFLKHLNQTQSTSVDGIAPEVMEQLMLHNWPGNVRELANVMECMVVLKQDGELGLEDLPQRLKTHYEVSSLEQVPMGCEGISLNTAVSEFEKNLIYQSLEKTNWVKKRAAQLLRVKRTTLVEKIKRYDLKKCA